MPDSTSGKSGNNTIESVHARWTVDTLAIHQAAVRTGDLMYQQALREADIQFHKERDRRYTEIAIEREKALKIKEAADLAALALAREIQTYKDEKANELREQINRERNMYASKTDLVAATEKLEETIKPIAAYVATQQGRSHGLQSGWGWILGAVGAAAAVASVISVTLK